MPTANSNSPMLKQQIGFIPALAANILNMVGVGPFLTIPLVITAMGGPQAMLGWGAGMMLALCDGLVWAELGASFPTSGGSYVYLREAYGARRWGRFMSFLFLAQTVLSAPLTAASGAVGFAEYATYLVPSLTYWQGRALAIVISALATFLLYRNIEAIGKISVLLTVLLLGTMGWIIGAGATHFQARLAFDFPAGAWHLSKSFFLGLGAATLIAMYDYSGYFNVCFIGAEVKRPSRNIPRCILISIILLGLCYSAMSFSIIGVLPWRQAAQSKAIVSDFFEHIAGRSAAHSVTVLILVAAFGSVYGVLLGYSRVPFAAALDAQFFAIFGRVHPRKGFPSFSVLALGAATAAACLLSLDALIKCLLVLQIATQFMAQCLGLLVIRRKRSDVQRPFVMPLYPIPVLIALFGWACILLSTGAAYIAGALVSIAAGGALFLVWSRKHSNWPFGPVAVDRGGAPRE